MSKNSGGAMDFWFRHMTGTWKPGEHPTEVMAKAGQASRSPGGRSGGSPASQAAPASRSKPVGASAASEAKRLLDNAKSTLRIRDTYVDRRSKAYRVMSESARRDIGAAECLLGKRGEMPASPVERSHCSYPVSVVTV
jgi:hypothetical protein